MPVLVVRHADGAVEGIHARVCRLDGLVDGSPLHVTSKLVLPYVERDDLLVAKLVFKHHHAPQLVIVDVFIQMAFAVDVRESRASHADGELLLAAGTLEHETLPSRELRLIEHDVVLAAGATDAFHGVMCIWTLRKVSWIGI